MVFNRQRRVRVAVEPLGEFLDRVTELLRLPRAAASVCLVSEPQIAEWNRIYRGKPGPTDVLSFPANGNNRGMVRAENRGRRKARRAAPPPRRNGAVPGAAYLGDIAIAPAVARRNARRFGRSLEAELRTLILHGVLHLAGYDHETDRGEMMRLERRARRRLGLG